MTAQSRKIRDPKVSREKAIVFLEIVGCSFQIADHFRQKGYQPVVLTLNPSGSSFERPPYDQFLGAVSAYYPCRSWLDPVTLLEDFGAIEQAYDVCGIFSRLELCFEAEQVLRAYIGQSSYTAEQVKGWLDKFRLRATLERNRLSALKTVSGGVPGRQLTWPHDEPFYFKPRRGADSVAVTRCRSMVDLQDAYAHWMSWLETGDGDFVNETYVGSNASYYLEQAALGDHVSLEALVYDGHLHVLGLTKRHQYSKDTAIGLGFQFPYQHPRQDKIADTAFQILQTIGFCHGVVHIEFIVPSSGTIELIDFNPRLVGSDVLRAMNFAYGCRIEDCLLDLVLDRPLSQPILTVTRYCDMRAFFPPEDVDQIIALEFPQEDGMLEYGQRLACGSRLKRGQRFVKDIAGQFLVAGDTPEKAAQIAEAVQGGIRINGHHRALR